MKKDNLIYLNNEKMKKEKTKRKVNISKLIGVIIITILIIAGITTYFVYANNEAVRKYIDENILQKDVDENSLNKISIEEYDKSTFFACQNKILILNGNVLTTYNTSAKKEKQESVDISTPLSAINNEFFVLAEKDGDKVYMIKDGSVEWTKEVEGQISKVSVNEMGYTTVIITGTAYKSVIELLDPNGSELFKRYLSNTTAVDSVVSKDCKYLAYAELNTSGTVIQSNIKVIDIEKAKGKQEEAIVHTYKADLNNLIIKIEYQNNNRLSCLFDSGICIIKEDYTQEWISYKKDGNNDTFITVSLDNYSAIIEEVSSGILSTASRIKFLNTSSGKENIYSFSGAAKDIYMAGNKIAVNLGAEIHFVDTKGWLIKKYTSTREARSIVISKNIAGIIYRDKIEIVNL